MINKDNLKYMSPQQIRADKKEARCSILEHDLRRRFLSERAFMALADEEKELIRTMLLAEMGYDPDITMRKNPWNARVLFHANYLSMSRDLEVLEFFDRYRIEYHE